MAEETQDALKRYRAGGTDGQLRISGERLRDMAYAVESTDAPSPGIGRDVQEVAAVLRALADGQTVQVTQQSVKERRQGQAQGL